MCGRRFNRSLVVLVLLSFVLIESIGGASDYERIYKKTEKASGYPSKTPTRTPTPRPSYIRKELDAEEDGLGGFIRNAKWRLKSLFNEENKHQTVKQIVVLIATIALAHGLLRYLTKSRAAVTIKIEQQPQQPQQKTKKKKSSSKEQIRKEVDKEKTKEKDEEKEEEGRKTEESNTEKEPKANDDKGKEKEEQEEVVAPEMRAEEDAGKEVDNTSEEAEELQDSFPERKEAQEKRSQYANSDQVEDSTESSTSSTSTSSASSTTSTSTKKDQEQPEVKKREKKPPKLNNGDSRELISSLGKERNKSSEIIIDHENKVAVVPGYGTYAFDDPALDTILKIRDYNRKEKTTKIKTKYHRTIVKKEEQQEKTQVAMSEWASFLSMTIFFVSLMLIWWSFYVIDYLPDHFFNLVWERVNKFFFSSLSKPHPSHSSILSSFVSESIFERFLEFLQPLVVPLMSFIVVLIVALLFVAIHMYLLAHLGAVLLAIDCLLAFLVLRDSFIRMFIYGAIGIFCHHHLAYYRSGPKLLRRVLGYSRATRKTTPSVYIDIKRWALSVLVSTALSWLVARGDTINPYSAPNYVDRLIYLVIS